MTSKKKVLKNKSYPSRAAHVPVTQGMLYGIRDVLKADVNSLEHKLYGVRDELKAGAISLQHNMNSRFDKMTSEIYRIAVLVEEQNSKNSIVLDGLTGLFGRQERVEKKTNDFEKILETFTVLK